VDETHSFGVLGKTGRGVTEHFDVCVDDIDLITGSLETSIGSCGGFCVGTKYVVDHQRLSGQGYCFSASLPPLLAAAADHALEKLFNGEAQDRPMKLQKLARQVHERLSGDDNITSYWIVSGAPESPLKHLRLVDNNTLTRLEEAVDLALEKDVLLTVARYLWEAEMKPPVPSVRLALNCDLTNAEVQNLISALVYAGRVLAKEEEHSTVAQSSYTPAGDMDDGVSSLSTPEHSTVANRLPNGGFSSGSDPDE
jgi:serine palmitoyltransferase